MSAFHKIRLFFLLFILLSAALAAMAQTPGKILRPCSQQRNPLDPNRDGWLSQSGEAFHLDDRQESEVAFAPLTLPEPEQAENCSYYDVVNNPFRSQDAAYLFFGNPAKGFFGGEDYLMLRIRLAQNPGRAAFGFSLLLDTDQALGRQDPNSTPENPGFELEIRLANIGMEEGLHLTDIDGRSGKGRPLASWPLKSCSQVAWALNPGMDCTQDPVFFDAMVPTEALGLAEEAPLRFALATTRNGASLLRRKAKDLVGTERPPQSVRQQMQTLAGLAKQSPAKPLASVAEAAAVLRHFAIRNEGQAANIRWEVPPHNPVSYFLVERSPNGQAFAAIKGLNPESGRTQYHYLDDSSRSGTTYYRLHFFLEDGTEGYSQILKAHGPEELGLRTPAQLWPNPVRQEGHFHLASSAEGLLHTRLFTPSGRQVWQRKHRSGEALSTSGLKAGVYHLLASDAAGAVTEKILVIR